MWQHILKSWPRSILEKVNLDETSSPCDRVTHPLCSISLRQTSKVTHKLAPWQICAWSALPKKKRDALSLAKRVIVLALCDETHHTLFTPDLHQMHGVFLRHTFVHHRTFFCTLLHEQCEHVYWNVVLLDSLWCSKNQFITSEYILTWDVHGCSFLRLKLVHKK